MRSCIHLSLTVHPGEFLGANPCPWTDSSGSTQLPREVLAGYLSCTGLPDFPSAGCQSRDIRTSWCRRVAALALLPR